MFSKHAAAAAVIGAVIGAGMGLHTQAQAQMSINGGITARFGSTMRSGDVQPDHDNTVNGVDGHFALFLTYTKDLKDGYNAGFNCITVATTADGAGKGFDAGSLPVFHEWDKVFATAENYAATKGGFASYGNVNGDSNGPMCNDEVNGFLQTPYGRFTAGNIMNPMRQLYDAYTVNPLWGNQRSYYVVADVRANAVQYSNSWDGLNVIAHLNTASNNNAAGADSAHDMAYTAVVSYDLGNGTVLGAGAMKADGGFEAKQVSASAFERHNAYGIAAKTRLGEVNVGYTYMRGSLDQNGQGAQLSNSESDHTVKVAYDMGKWSFQGFLSKEKLSWSTPLANYTVVAPGAFTGQTFRQLDTDRKRVDLWALYDMGKDVKTYLRLDTIQKTFTSQQLAGFSATMRVTLLEGGWMINF